MPTLLFGHIYTDTMHLPKSSRFKYIIQGQCLLCHWPKFNMLAAENRKSLREFILCSFIYQWGTLFEIVTDNSTPFVKAMEYLAKCCHIVHVRISSYNSHANGVIE